MPIWTTFPTKCGVVLGQSTDWPGEWYCPIILNLTFARRTVKCLMQFEWLVLEWLTPGTFNPFVAGSLSMAFHLAAELCPLNAELRWRESSTRVEALVFRSGHPPTSAPQMWEHCRLSSLGSVVLFLPLSSNPRGLPRCWRVSQHRYHI